VVEQIPAPRQHLTRYYGAYANRKRSAMHSAQQAGETQAESRQARHGAVAGVPEDDEAYRHPRPS